MSADNNDILNGFKALGIGVLIGFIFSPRFAAVVFAGIAIYFGFAGLMILFSESEQGRPGPQARRTKRDLIPSTTSAPTPTSATIAEKIAAINAKHGLKCPSCGATIKATDTKCRFCGSYLILQADLPKPAKFGDVEVDQTIRVTHPQKGQLTLRVQRRLYYGELWQERIAPNVPWTLTGNYYVGLGLVGEIFLLSWQERYYLLDSHSPLMDNEVNRDFAPHARQFAASNQTAKVEFGYGGTNWRIEDIGKFRIELADGEGTRIDPGAIGRFIHASRENQVLVVEDYQSGGNGLDRLWKGYKIEEQDIEL